MEIHLSGASWPAPLLSSCLPPHTLFAGLLFQHLLAAITSISGSPRFQLLQLGRSNKQQLSLHLPSLLQLPVQSLPTLPLRPPQPSRQRTNSTAGAHVALHSLMHFICQTGEHHRISELLQAWTKSCPLCLKRGYFWPISMHLSADGNTLQAFEKAKEKKKSKVTCQDGPFSAEEVT